MYLDRSAGVSENLLQKFSMDKAKPVSTLVIVNTKLKMVSVDEMYRNAVGSLLYLLTRTRPDMAFAVTLPNSIEQLWNKYSGICITSHYSLQYEKSNWSLLYLLTSTLPDIAFAVNSVALFSSYPTKQHWTVVKRIFRYLVILLLVTTVLHEHLITEPTIVFEDNQFTICMAPNFQFHGCGKHFSINYHFLREQVNSNVIKLRYFQIEILSNWKHDGRKCVD